MEEFIRLNTNLMARAPFNESMPVREEIRQMALIMFSEGGYHAVSMRKLAAAVGLQAGSIYVHFESKEALLIELIEEFEEGLLCALEKNVSKVETSKRLATYVRTSLDFHIKNRRSELLARHDLRHITWTHQKLIRETQYRRQLLLTNLVHTTPWSESDLTLGGQLLVKGVEAIIDGASDWFTQYPIYSPQDLAETTCQLVLCMLRSFKGAIRP